MLFSPFQVLSDTGAELTDDQIDPILEAYGFLEAFLSGRQWMAGEEMTIADLQILATIVSMEMIISIDEERSPLLAQWLQREKSCLATKKPNREDWRYLER